MTSVNSYLNIKEQKILICEKFQVDHTQKNEAAGKSCYAMKTIRNENKVSFMGLGKRSLGSRIKHKERTRNNIMKSRIGN